MIFQNLAHQFVRYILLWLPQQHRFSSNDPAKQSTTTQPPAPAKETNQQSYFPHHQDANAHS